MLGDGEDAPPRYELSMVKKHSTMLGNTTVTEQDASDVEMDGDFWHDVLDLYFIRGKESRGLQDDDLVFFVRKMGEEGYGFNDNVQGISSYFVRKWAPKLDNLISANPEEVNWRQSFYLNLIAHTLFTVTVAICSHQVLLNHHAGKDTPLSAIYKVVKTVCASPSCEVETTPAYPDICFAVDDFDSTFDAVTIVTVYFSMRKVGQHFLAKKGSLITFLGAVPLWKSIQTPGGLRILRLGQLVSSHVRIALLVHYMPSPPTTELPLIYRLIMFVTKIL